MSDYQPSADVAVSTEAPKPKRRRLKSVLVFLVVFGAGTAAAFHFFKKPPERGPIVEYAEPDEAEAAAQVQKAKTQQELDQEALKAAQEELQTIQGEWESAKRDRDKAEQNLAGALARDRMALEKALAEAETRFAQASENLTQAKARLKAAEDKLKTAEELLAEAESERIRVEKQIAQETAIRKAILGEWERSDYYGGLTLELREDGTGLMVVNFNGVTSFVVGADRLEVDIKWTVASGDHLIFDSLRGRPQKAFDFVSKEKGSRRDQILTHIDETNFTTHDADNKSKVKTWTRIKGS
jgi:hypothetical protein